STAAICSSLNWALNAGIAPLYVAPLTVSGPLMPCSMMAAAVVSGPVTHSDPASGGKTPGSPAPVAWWQAAHADAYVAAPSTSAPAAGLLPASSSGLRPSPQAD